MRSSCFEGHQNGSFFPQSPLSVQRSHSVDTGNLIQRRVVGGFKSPPVAAERPENLLEMKVIKSGISAVQYYKMAADGFPRSVIAMDRLVDMPNPSGTPGAATLWASEMRYLSEVADRLNLSAESEDKPYYRVFGRGLPEGSPYFEASRDVAFTILNASGFQIFTTHLGTGERVRIDRASVKS